MVLVVELYIIIKCLKSFKLVKLQAETWKCTKNETYKLGRILAEIKIKTIKYLDNS